MKQKTDEGTLAVMVLKTLDVVTHDTAVILKVGVPIGIGERYRLTSCIKRRPAIRWY